MENIIIGPGQYCLRNGSVVTIVGRVEDDRKNGGWEWRDNTGSTYQANGLSQSNKKPWQFDIVERVDGLKLQAGKYYRNREGGKVFIAAVDVANPFRPTDKETCLGYVAEDKNPRWFKANGAKLWSEGDNGLDLVDEWKEPKRIKGWFNVYTTTMGKPDKHPWGYLHPTREAADADAGPGRIACIELDVLEGEGL